MTQELVEKFKQKKLDIATMESCTSGALANEITSISGASEILKFSAITYSKEDKYYNKIIKVLPRSRKENK